MQRTIAPDKLARVAAYGWMGAMVFLPAGYALAGPISTVVGMRAYLLFGAGWLVASTLVVIRLRGVREFGSDDATDAVPAAGSVGAPRRAAAFPSRPRSTPSSPSRIRPSSRR